MKKFLIKVLAICLPIFIMVVIYISLDVFRVVRHHDYYFRGSDYIWINREYVSTMTYLNQKDKFKYDSFIFGNSRSAMYEIDTWKRYLPNGSRCYHFDASVGSISGLSNEILFIDKTNGNLRNALLVIDNSILSIYEPGNNRLFANPPILRNDSNFLAFHIANFAAFYNIGFLTALVDYSCFGHYRKYMEGYLIEPNQYIYLQDINEYRESSKEVKIKKGTYYDTEHLEVFQNIQKPGTYSTKVIGNKEITCLKDIKEIFDKHNTSYKIVISPLYDQIKLNRKNYNILCSIFGKENVYDFSGPNKWNKDYHNYYESSHYRPHVAAEIMDIIYSKSQPSK